MKAPEKIYFGAQAVNPFYGLTRKCASDDIEYVRLDAFIDKACEWIRYNRWKYEDSKEGNEAMEKDFRKAIKGE